MYYHHQGMNKTVSRRAQAKQDKNKKGKPKHDHTKSQLAGALAKARFRGARGHS